MSATNASPPNRGRCQSITGRCPNVAKASSRGMCRKHYKAWCRTNRPVPFPEMQAHIDHLRTAGFGYRRIANLAGVGFTTVREIAHPRTPRRFVSGPIAAKLLAITTDDRPARMNPAGSCRRIQALIALGYTENVIADACGISQPNLWKYTANRASWVRPETFDRIDAVFRDLALQPMPQGWVAERARRRATRRGWVVPLAWDERAIDDPHARPVPAAALDWIAHVVECRRHGWPDNRIAADMGIETESLWRRLERAGLPRNHGRAAA